MRCWWNALAFVCLLPLGWPRLVTQPPPPLNGRNPGCLETTRPATPRGGGHGGCGVSLCTRKWNGLMCHLHLLVTVPPLAGVKRWYLLAFLFRSPSHLSLTCGFNNSHFPIYKFAGALLRGYISHWAPVEPWVMVEKKHCLITRVGNHWDLTGQLFAFLKIAGHMPNVGI